MTAAVEYPFTIRPLTEAEGGGYWISFPDLPGCVEFGATVAEAIDAGAEACQSWIEQLTALGRVVPQPRSVTDRPRIGEAQRIKKRIERIGKASTQDQWNRCTADAVFDLLRAAPGADGSSRGDWRLPLGLGLSKLIEVGFKPMPNRAPNVLQEEDDAKLLEYWLLEYPEMSFADASYAFGVRFEIDKDPARKRVERAEKHLDNKLPRERPFGRKPPPLIQ